MPKVSEIFQQRNLKVGQLNGQPRVEAIEGWDIETSYGEDHYVLYFLGKKQTLRLNATNARDIARLYGDDMDGWIDKQIEIYPDQIPITDKETKEKKMVDVIRVRAPATSPAPSSPKAAKSVTAPAKADLDDEIPF